MTEQATGRHDAADGGSSPGSEPSIVPPGEFPFPRLSNGRESRQLVWLRNHASYTASGTLDYARLVSVLVRGILVNLLFAMPLLLLMGLAVAILSVRNWQFPALVATAAAAALWILLAPLLTRAWNAGNRSSIHRLGSSSSVVLRNRLERTFAALMIAIVVAAVIEGMAASLDTFHNWTREDAGWKWIATAGPFLLGTSARHALNQRG